MTKEEILKNQALVQHMLFFSPLNKKPTFEMIGGEPKIQYFDEKEGIRVLDFGKAEAGGCGRYPSGFPLL